MNGGEIPRRLANEHPNVVPYRDFFAADGDVIVALGNDAQFRVPLQLCSRDGEGDRPPRLSARGSPEAVIYGYLNRVRSSRRLEAETHRNIEVIWLLRHLRPDFKTIADFRRDNSKHSAQSSASLCCFAASWICLPVMLAVDGTRIKAVNNKDRNFTRASLSEFIRLAHAKLEDYLRRLDQSDVTENPAGGARVKPAEKIAAIGARRTRCTEMLRNWIRPEKVRYR